MSSALTMAIERSRLRVTVYSNDALRKSALIAIVGNAGHCVSETPDEADVIVEDGTLIRLSEPDDAEVAGTLPVHATPEQIIAAIQAVAAGLSVRVRDAGGDGFGAPPEPRLQ